MTVSPVERPVASAAYSFVRFIGGGLAPYVAGRLVLAAGIHVPFFIAVGVIVAGIGILATAGSDEWLIVPELAPGDQEPLVEKHYGDSFEDTTLESVLSGLGVGRLVVVGAQTDACIRSTLHGAFARGYDATLVSDAHTTEDQTAWGAPPPDQVIAHTNLYWADQTAPGRTAGTVETKDVGFGTP